MRRVLPILAVLLMLAPFPTGAVPQTGDSEHHRVAPDLVVTEAVFGYVDPRTGRLVETRQIDTSKHKGFGWRVRLEGARREIHFREEFVLPAPAKTWQVGTETTISPDRASAVTEGRRELDRDMLLRNAWFHTPGDPKGKHVMRVWVEGVLVQQFDFVLR